MVLNITQGSYTIKIAPELEQYANQWEFTPDIEINGPDEGSADACNAAPFTGCLSVFPLTSFSHWKDRFIAVAKWQPYGGPGGFNTTTRSRSATAAPTAGCPWPRSKAN